MGNESALLYNLLAPEVRGNPHAMYHDMRENAPVYHSELYEMGERPWILTRYDDALAILKDTRLTKDFMKKPGIDTADGDPMMAGAASINRHMLTVDPPDHTRLRSLVHKAFTPKMIREFNGRVQQLADELLDKVEGQKQMDLITSYAIPLPITVIAELLGVPSSDQVKFREWSQIIIVDSLRGGDMEKLATTALEFIMYFHDLFDKRRENPQEDLITGLLQVEENGDTLDPQELISMIFLLLAAGHETTVNLIGNGTLALLQNRGEMEKLQANPNLIASAVEEMLRYDGPIGISTQRWAMEDVEMHGVTIPKGSLVVASLLAANRDPAHFENPDRFDITRDPNKHIAFGHGIHYCLGAPLARMEGAVAINTLLRRLPKLELAVDVDDLDWNETLLLHGMSAMPVAF